MAASTVMQQQELLTSWKEIASHLGKGVRTVQRWEKQFGLPVRRPNERSKGIVHATRKELDAWLEEQWSQRPAEMARESQSQSVPVAEIQAHLQHALELRSMNRQLLQDVTALLKAFCDQCATMSQNLVGTPPLRCGNWKTVGIDPKVTREGVSSFSRKSDERPRPGCFEN